MAPNPFSCPSPVSRFPFPFPLPVTIFPNDDAAEKSMHLELQLLQGQKRG